jgi:hypothetical protein
MEATMSIGDALSSIPSAVTSPAKLAFIAYVILAYAGKITTSKSEFIAITLLFFAFQVLHDDYVRIWLNKKAELQADKARQKAFDGKHSNG